MPTPSSWVCPECESGKHRNCNGTAWDFDADKLVPCGCPDPTAVCRLAAETPIFTRTTVPLPLADEARREAVSEVERQWWHMIGEEHVVVTHLPTTTATEVGRDLAAHIDSKLSQPYGYEPPMVLVLVVEGRGRKVLR